METKRADGRVDAFPTSVATEGTLMVSDSAPPILSEFDQGFYRSIVPADHYLRKVLRVVSS